MCQALFAEQASRMTSVTPAAGGATGGLAVGQMHFTSQRVFIAEVMRPGFAVAPTSFMSSVEGGTATIWRTGSTPKKRKPPRRGVTASTGAGFFAAVLDSARTASLIRWLPRVTRSRIRWLGGKGQGRES